MYLIAEWLERYECNDKNQPAKKGDKLRVSPLTYIRSKIHGRSQGTGFARLQNEAGDKAYEVFGIFLKFLEIAGCEKGGERGILKNEKGEPANLDDLAFILRTKRKKIEHALQVLTLPTVRWIIDDSPEIPGKVGVFLNTTQLKTTQLNSTHIRSKEDFDHFWSEYPKKVGKVKCQAVWSRLNPSPELVEKIVSKVKIYKETEQWKKDNGQYIPHPLTWLNAESWDDVIEQQESEFEKLKASGDL